MGPAYTKCRTIRLVELIGGPSDRTANICSSPTHPAWLRAKARELPASKRLTIDELAERLALSRSTIYSWVRDMPIPGSGPGGVWPTAAQKKGTRAMQRKYRLLRDQAYAEGTATS
jgi:excisionase family DNA binding protein